MDYPALTHLMGAYFHQDWFEEHGDEWATLQDFLDHEPGASAVADEIPDVLARFESEKALGDYLWSIGSYYTPAAGGRGYRGWLEAIAERARRVVPEPKAHLALDQLMGAYLHQDYDLFGPTPLAAVDTFVRDEPELGSRLPGEISDLLRALPSETAIKAALEGMGCQIVPSTADGGYRGWLEAIADRARQTRTRTGAPVDYPALTHLMGAYFNQDYDLMGEDDRAVVSAFLHNNPELGRGLAHEIDGLLGTDMPEAELNELLTRLGCEVEPWSKDGTYRTWLAELASYTRASTK